MMKSSDMESIYRKLALEDIPWNNAEPPDALVHLVETRTVLPCRTIELGCGAGNYAVYLASRGFEVTGVDISKTAIEIARRNALEKQVNCDFVVADVLGELSEIKGTFSFAFDWELLHHICPENRDQYVQNVRKLLDNKGKYLSVCFSEKDPGFGAKGKYRRTSLDTVLYFSSEEELSDLFSRYFTIIELKTVEIAGRATSHYVVYAFMENR